MNYTRCIILPLFVLLGLNCQAQISKEEKQWLIKKTLNDLVFVEGGTFQMGDVGYIDKKGKRRRFEGSRETLPVHQVTLDSYSMGKLEVTNKEFDLFCKEKGLELAHKKYRDNEDAKAIVQASIRATGMDWHQAKAYCEWLSELTGLLFSLARDAQWEYAARSRGKAVGYATDNGKIEYDRNYQGKAYISICPPPPGTYPPNPLGIYNMSDGAPEWTLDYWYDYMKHAVTNPVHTMGSYTVVVRGFCGVRYSIYGRGPKLASNKGIGACIRFVVNQKKPVNVRAVLKRLGIPPITSKERKSFKPTNWPYIEHKRRQ